MNAGRCLACDAPTWRTAYDPSMQRDILLWPLPSSRYASVLTAYDAHGQRHLTPGIGYCQGCAPKRDSEPTDAVKAVVPGATSVAEVVEAKVRYAAWFAPKFGGWLRAHARDHLKMDDGAIETLMACWESDRA